MVVVVSRVRVPRGRMPFATIATTSARPLSSLNHARAEYFLISGAAKIADGARNNFLALFSAPYSQIDTPVYSMESGLTNTLLTRYWAWAG